MISIILNWRQFRFAVTADIEKMYRQILIDVNQRDLQRIIWRASEDEPLKAYRLNTITYGTANAPYLAIRTLFQLANDECNQYPEACEMIKNAFYVDDFLYGADTLEEMVTIYQQIRAVMRKGKLNLRKWSSNSDDFNEVVPTEDRENTTQNSVKALGLHWNPKSDKLTFEITIDHKKQTFTKRELLSEMSSLFDPLGFISPIIISGKKLFQMLWIDEIG